MDENTGSNSYYQDNTANLQYQQPPVEEGPSKANGLQVAGLILGILGIVTCCCYGIVGFIFSVIGLILSIVGNKRGKNGVGTAALVCSIIGLILSVIASIYYGYVIYLKCTL